MWHFDNEEMFTPEAIAARSKAQRAYLRREGWKRRKQRARSVALSSKRIVFSFLVRVSA